MVWLVKLSKDGASIASEVTFDTAHDAVEAANSAIRSGDADDVTVANGEHEGIYYQFGTLRTSSEEQRIARMLEAESVTANRA